VLVQGVLPGDDETAAKAGFERRAPIEQAARTGVHAGGDLGGEPGKPARSREGRPRRGRNQLDPVTKAPGL
jgi:hypothetical protein